MNRVRIAACAVAVLCGTASAARAQAWVAEAGAGAVTIAAQFIDNTGHIRTDGSTAPVGRSHNAAIYLEADYAITDRISISAGMPFVFARYVGPRPPPGIPEPPMVRAVDLCYCWQKGWQDFGFTARVNLLNGVTAVTPSISAGVPGRNYEYIGEAVVGRGLREWRLAVDVGRRLDAISPRVAVQGRYSYAIVERVLDIGTNRSNASAGVVVGATPWLSVSGSVTRQVTHGGLRAGVGPPSETGPPWGEITTPELFEQHDRIMRDNYWHAGAGATVRAPGGELSFSYTEYLSGSDTHAGRAFTAGFTRSFRIGR